LIQFEMNEASILPEQNFPAFIVMFEHPASKFEIDPSLDNIVYRITDSRVDDYEKLEEQGIFAETFYDIYLEALSHKKGILVINYNPSVALFMEIMVSNLKREKNIDIFCFAFFHSLEKTDLPKKEKSILSAAKDKLFDIMSDFPYIKKIEIPYNYKIDSAYINRLVNDFA